MSRTYHHGRLQRYWKDYYNSDAYMELVSRSPYGLQTYKISRYHIHPNWAYIKYCKNPNWWDHEFITIPSRRKSKLLCKSLQKLTNFNDYTPFPDYKKPIIYYW